jgi:hypothetical protein
MREESIMKASNNLTRRDLLRRSAVLAAPWFVPAAALGRDGKTAASERVTLGVIVQNGDNQGPTDGPPS